MILEGFGITLTPLQESEIELVRFWRNSDEIKRYALQQETISQEQQRQWFASLQKKEDEYFIIRIDSVPVGLIWFNRLDNNIETGFYIYDTSFQNTLTPYKIVTLFHRYLFDEKGVERISCKIMHDNPRAVRFNLSLGYLECEQCPAYNRYELSMEEYRRANAKISKLLLKESV